MNDIWQDVKLMSNHALSGAVYLIYAALLTLHNEIEALRAAIKHAEKE